MKITRRDLTIGGLSLFASTSMIGTSHAEVGDFLNIGEGAGHECQDERARYLHGPGFGQTGTCVS
jgi:hypothetical protein